MMDHNVADHSSVVCNQHEMLQVFRHKHAKLFHGNYSNQSINKNTGIDVQSKASRNQLNLPHGTETRPVMQKKW